MIARIANRSHGVVARGELLRAGVSERQIDRRLQRGTLIVEYDGVYRIGHRAPSIEASYMAAVKACGEGAVLRGRAAAHLWGLIKRPPPEPEVLAPTERKVRGILTTRARAGIHKRDRTKYRGVPVTTVARTVVDVACLYGEGELARIFHEAAVLHRVKPRHVEAVLERRPNSPGAKRLRRVIHGDAAVLLSELESAFFELLRGASLSLPRTNRPKGAHYVDCRWPADGVTVELDSYTYHSTRHAWEQDHKRDREAWARGDRIRRFTYGEVMDEPQYVLDSVRELLSRAGR